MAPTADQKALEPLDVFVGGWSMATSLAPNPADAPRARTTFEWLPGRRSSSSGGRSSIPTRPGVTVVVRLSEWEGAGRSTAASVYLEIWALGLGPDGALFIDHATVSST